MTRKNRVAYIVFTKNPILGRVKTRLAKDLGDREALRIYQAMLRHILNVLKAFPSEDVKIYIDERPDDTAFLAPFHRQVFIQKGEDLGAKMDNAIAEQLQEYPQVILFGSDIPELDVSVLALAAQRLKDHDVVLGPTIDGGYYLIGMKERCSPVFQNMPWSTDQVAKTTIQRLTKRSASLFLTPVLGDVDYREDWEQYRQIVEQ